VNLPFASDPVPTPTELHAQSLSDSVKAYFARSVFCHAHLFTLALPVRHCTINNISRSIYVCVSFAYIFFAYVESLLCIKTEA